MTWGQKLRQMYHSDLSDSFPAFPLTPAGGTGRYFLVGYTETGRCDREANVRHRPTMGTVQTENNATQRKQHDNQEAPTEISVPLFLFQGQQWNSGFFLQKDLPINRGGDGGGGFFLACEDFRRLFDYSVPVCPVFILLIYLFIFEVEISSRTLSPLFTPGSVHSGSAIWDDCGRMFPDRLRVSSFPDRFPHYAWKAAQSDHSDFVESKVYVCLGVTCQLHFSQNDWDILRATAVTRG